MHRLAILFLIISHFITDFVTCAGWEYSGLHGPSNWSHIPGYEKCDGEAQSPISIPPAETVKYDSNLTPFILNGFGSSVSSRIFNNGHTAQLDILGDVTVEGGGLPQMHKTAQLHFHWGDTDDKGSEHIMYSMSYPLEMHIVNFNSKYGNLSQAVSQSDGLAVLGFFFKVSPNDNPDLTPFINHLTNIRYADQEEPVIDVDLRKLVLSQLDRYFRYKGSLTTPPCYESVTWTVFEEAIPISSLQLSKFRGLYEKINGTTDNHKLTNNFRPPLPLNSRQIYRSFIVNSANLCTFSFVLLLAAYFCQLF